MSNKKSIYKQIIQSQILVIIIFGITTTWIFTATLNLYIKNQTNKQLITTAEALKKSFKADLTKEDSSDSNDIKITNNLLKVNSVLKEEKIFSDVNFALINKSKEIIFPKKTNDKSEEVAQELISNIDYKISSKKNKVININIKNSKYAYLTYEIDFEGDNKGRFLILYADLDKRVEIVRTLNFILICIILFSTIISLIISRVTAKKLSKPIYKLIDISKKISDKNYPLDNVDFENKEINDLADSMSNMSKKLYNYDNVMKTFVENSSHELRTPLMSIQGYAEGLKYKVIDDTDSALDIIIKESKRMSYIIEDLLYLSKLDSIEETIEKEKLNVDSLIRSTIERISGIALREEKKILYTQLDDSIFIYGSEEKLTRAFLNLLSNSLRYAKEEVSIKIKSEETNLIIIIEDDGVGFIKDEIDKVFDRFYKGKMGNCGLGLAITKTIISKHNGKIIAENRECGGARVTVTWGE